MFRNTDEKAMNQRLKVQELTVRFADTHLYSVDGADVIVKVGQPLTAAVSCLVYDDSVPGVVVKPASTLSIVDKDSPYGAGGDASAIRIATLTLAANDVIRLQYITQG